VIVDVSVIVDVVADAGPRGDAARAALGSVGPTEPLTAPGLFASELLSALNAVARRPAHPFGLNQLPAALDEAERYGITIQATPWGDVRRAYELCQGSLRFADAVYVAAAERQGTELLTSDARIARSGAPFRCQIVTVT
jgi:predicted nucleic acid-binding protein